MSWQAQRGAGLTKLPFQSVPGVVEFAKKGVLDGSRRRWTDKIASWRVPGGAGLTKIVFWRAAGGVGSTEIVSWRVPGGAGSTKVVFWRAPGGVGSTKIVFWRAPGRPVPGHESVQCGQHLLSQNPPRVHFSI